MFRIYSKKIFRTIILSSLCVTAASPVFANDVVDEGTCITNDACPKILEISLLSTIRQQVKNETPNFSQNLVAKVIKIANKSKRNVSTVIVANYDGTNVDCSNILSIPARSSIEAGLTCDVPSSTSYLLFDKDGRSNKLQINAIPDGPSPIGCSDKSIGEKCGGGTVFRPANGSTPGLVIATENLPSAQRYCFNSGVTLNADSTTDGFNNTINIESNCPNNNNAAVDCLGYSVTDENGTVWNDWYLPAIDELTEFFNSGANSSISPSLSGTYWSSTESTTPFTDFFAVEINLDTGVTNTQVRESFRSVTCIQSFNN